MRLPERVGGGDAELTHPPTCCVQLKEAAFPVLAYGALLGHKSTEEHRRCTAIRKALAAGRLVNIVVVVAVDLRLLRQRVHGARRTGLARLAFEALRHGVFQAQRLADGVGTDGSLQAERDVVVLIEGLEVKGLHGAKENLGREAPQVREGGRGLLAPKAGRQARG